MRWPRAIEYHSGLIIRIVVAIIIEQIPDITTGLRANAVMPPGFFGKIPWLMEILGSVNLHLVSAMDTTGVNAIERVVERMKRRHSTVILSGIHQQPLQMLRNAGFIDVIGRDNLCAT